MAQRHGTGGFITLAAAGSAKTPGRHRERATRSLYARAGFVLTEPFGDNRPSRASIFMTPVLRTP